MSNIAEKIVDEDIDSIIEDIKDFSSILQGKRFLLIGGSGFLGTYFYKTLIALNEILPKPIKITIIDNIFSYTELVFFTEVKIKNEFKS